MKKGINSIGMFKIELNYQLASDLRNIVNEEQNISINKPLKINKTSNQTAWDLLCAIMDRLQDTVYYINGLELNTGRHSRSAFDFFDFMNNASVIIDCVNELARIFEYDLSVENLSFSIFNKRGKDNNGTDRLYFEYLRSLCSVHPISTNRHARYQDNEFECSPFVVWNDRFGYRNEGDLCAFVYTSRHEANTKMLMIHISEVFAYVEFRFNLISKIIYKIKEYHASEIDQFIQRRIKPKNEYESYIDYLHALIEESKERFGNDTIYELEFTIELLKLKISDPKNQSLYERYCNAFKHAIQFRHNALQNMSYQGYENSGIKYPERNIETTLLNELYSPCSHSEERQKYSYQIGKTSYLLYDSGGSNKHWARLMIQEGSSFFSKYISFNCMESDFELYALVHMALYQECLENKCSLNKNIPNDLKYRHMILSDDEYSNLIQPEAETETSDNVIIIFDDILD